MNTNTHACTHAHSENKINQLSFTISYKYSAASVWYDNICIDIECLFEEEEKQYSNILIQLVRKNYNNSIV